MRGSLGIYPAKKVVTRKEVTTTYDKGGALSSKDEQRSHLVTVLEAILSSTVCCPVSGHFSLTLPKGPVQTSIFSCTELKTYLGGPKLYKFDG